MHPDNCLEYSAVLSNVRDCRQQPYCKNRYAKADLLSLLISLWLRSVLLLSLQYLLHIADFLVIALLVVDLSQAKFVVYQS